MVITVFQVFFLVTVNSLSKYVSLHNSVPMASSDTSDLFYRLLGNPQDNVTKAISAFVQEFEVLLNWITKRATSLPDPNDSLTSDLRMVPETLEDAKRGLAIDLDVTSAKAKSTAKRLEELQKAISASVTTVFCWSEEPRCGPNLIAFVTLDLLHR
ncbi:MAG: hypothetical protein BYD32DRAFT_434496 [Podila humilis]|nr:MAG: hypothetical protein BYD32DRAFT_434496 [Podila humilis]